MRQTTHDESQPYTRLLVNLPSGGETYSVTVVTGIGRGQISSSTARVSYQACCAGKVAVAGISYACSDCPPGYFAGEAGAVACQVRARAPSVCAKRK